jgi:hypothetical protein
MKKQILFLTIAVAFTSTSLAAGNKTSTSNTPTVGQHTESASVEKKSKKKKKESFFAMFDIIEKIKVFVQGKSKQNENAISDAAEGNFKARGTRKLASDPKARAIQEKLDKLQEERLKKYETTD